MAKSERLRQSMVSREDLCFDRRIQAGITFGFYGQEALDALFGASSPIDHAATVSYGHEVVNLGADKIICSVTSMLTFPATDNEDAVIVLWLSESEPTIALSAPIYNSRYTTKAILEIARSTWLEHIDLIPDPSVDHVDQPMLRSYVEGFYLDQSTFGFFCVNQISPGFLPISGSQNLPYQLMGYRDLSAVDFDDPASVFTLDYIWRKSQADEQLFDTPLIAQPNLTRYRN